jgi:phosphoenolpyruvate carboxylase
MKTPFSIEAADGLRHDVRYLGALLGDALREQGGDELFQVVEQSRLAARSRRDGDGTAERTLDVLLTGLEPQRAAEVAQAFSAYFSLVNMAERVHRIRRRREYLRSGTPQPGSLEDVLRRLAASGITRQQALSLVAEILVEPVYTAHPTEAIRRTILAKEQRVAMLLIDRLQHIDRTPPEEEALTGRLRDEITLMWQTAEHSGVKRTVADEVEHVLFYLIDVIYRIVPALDESMESALQAAYGRDASADVVAPFVRFGSWVGGDMDGNPNVGPETIQGTLERQRQLIIERYIAEVREIFGHLSQSRSRITVDPELEERCADYRQRMPEVAAEIPARYDDMPYRILLWFSWARLEATLAGGTHAYPTADAFRGDLELITDSLRRHKGEHAGLLRTIRLAQRAATFGFHLATLDVRQDALVHRVAVAATLDDPEFVDASADSRTEALRTALEGQPVSRTPAHPDAAASLAVFRCIAEARKVYGSDAIGPYIISMAQGPDDALAVLYLAHSAGLVGGDGAVPLDVAPLFETVPDLEHAGETLAALLDDPIYRAHVTARGDRQIVMLGYSDSSKESGLAASRWALYRAESDLSEVADRAGVELTLFHGRGGTPSRGGSKPRAGILAQPPGVMHGRMRLTEQGEIIHAKYGLRGIALRTLELTTGAVLEASAPTVEANQPHPDFTDAMSTVARAGREFYRALVYEDADFIPYFRTATPIDIIERLEIGSRPASRRSGGGVENLRAIPWVFSWTQNRHLLPGWYGVGAGLAAAIDAHGEEVLRDMAGDWPFFENLLADVEMVLAKADMGIGERYSKLAGETGERLFPRILAEYERTRSLICRLRGIQEPLEREPVLRRSIRLRNPYVDPISLLQVDLLKRWRASDRQDQELEEALKVTVRGIARGLQNTG